MWPFRGKNGTLSGLIKDRTGKPVVDVAVSADGIIKTKSNRNGYYSIKGFKPGSYVIGFAKVGYYTVTF